MDFAKSLLGSVEAEPKKDFASSLLSTRAPSSDELVEDPNLTTGVGAQFKAGFASDEEEVLRVFAQDMFPDEPIDEAVKRFGTTEDGRLFARTDDGRFVEVTPQGFLDAAPGAVARGVGKSIPVATGTIAGISTAPAAITGVGLLGTMAATGGAAAVGEVVRQKVGDFILGDASTNNIRVSPKKTAAAFRAGKKQGVTLTPGQASGSRVLLAEEKRLATRVPETVDAMDDFLRQQGDDTISAFNRFLGKIAPEADADQVARQVRGAAQGVLDDVVAARSRAASPIYAKAFKESGDVATDEVFGVIDKALVKAPRGGVINGALTKIRSFLVGENGGPIRDLEGLHNARIEISNMIETRSSGANSLSRTAVGKLKAVMNELTRAMDKGSVKDSSGQSVYKLARRVFSEVSGEVDDVSHSALARIAKISDTDTLRVVNEAFNPRTRSPEMIMRLKSRLVSKDPGAWNSLRRLWLSDVVSSKINAAESGRVLNPAGKILKVLDNFQTRRSINAALSAKERKSMEDLKFVLRRVARLQTGGSDTAANVRADKLALQRAAPIWARAQERVLNFWRIPEAITDAAAERNFRNQAQQMVELVTSGDAKALASLRELRQLTPNQWRALSLSGQLAVRGPGAASAALSALDKDSGNTGAQGSDNK